MVPFPDKQQMYEELKRDILFHKISPGEYGKICDIAWGRGVSAANRLFLNNELSVNDLISQEKIIIQRNNKDNVVGNIRCFGEYYSRDNKIVIYVGSVRYWAKANVVEYAEAENAILAHEFFHFLECKRIGEGRHVYKVPLFKIGRRAIVYSGLRCVSEIGAHGFAKTYYKLRRC